jgi:hypothetical protein
LLDKYYKISFDTFKEALADLVSASEVEKIVAFVQ